MLFRSGGEGSLLMEVMLANVDANGVLFDQPSVALAAKHSIARAGFADRCTVSSGNFFESVPTGGDVYMMKTILHDWVREDKEWKHNSPDYSDCERHNAGSHLRAILLGHSQTVMVQDGEPALGEWQSIIFAELDGPREREIRLQLIGI